jgi:type II secretion system protein N
LDGEVNLLVDRLRANQTEGKIDVSFQNFNLKASDLKVAGTTMALPDMVFSQKKGSRMKLDITRGQATVDIFTFEGGDLELNLKGKIFLAASWQTYRLNLTGSFKMSEKLAEAFPFLFIIERQKQQDGSFPLAVSGRLTAPNIRIGTFSVPL